MYPGTPSPRVGSTRSLPVYCRTRVRGTRSTTPCQGWVVVGVSDRNNGTDKGGSQNRGTSTPSNAAMWVQASLAPPDGRRNWLRNI